MKRTSAALMGAWFGLASLAPWSSAFAATTKVSPGDQQFVATAAQSDATEIAASKLALQKSSNDDVKKFARAMIDQHTALDSQLRSNLPQGIEAPPKTADSGLIDSLRMLQGKDFDSAYVSKVALEGHDAAVAAFEKEADSGTNTALKKTAKKALPEIKRHLQMANRLAKATGVSATD